MKYGLSIVFPAVIAIGLATGAMAETPDAFVRQAVSDMNRNDPSLESRVLEAKLLAAYKRAIEINDKKNCQDAPSLGGDLNQQDGHELVFVKTLGTGTKSAQVRVGFGLLILRMTAFYICKGSMVAGKSLTLEG
jgi:hypothetical protein